MVSEDLDTELFSAVISGGLDAVKKLVDGGANIDAKAEGGWTPLMVATEKGHAEIAFFLLEKGANPNVVAEMRHSTPLLIASRYKRFNIATALIQKGADVNALETDGTSSLLWAAENGDIETARMLISSGAKLEIADNNIDFTPLMWAVNTGNMEMASLLIKSGASPNTPTSYLRTPLMWAAQKNMADMAEFLINSGAEINAKDKKGRTALGLAEAEGNKDMIKLLKLKGAED